MGEATEEGGVAVGGFDALLYVGEKRQRLGSWNRKGRDKDQVHGTRWQWSNIRELAGSQLAHRRANPSAIFRVLLVFLRAWCFQSEVSSKLSADYSLGTAVFRRDSLGIKWWCAGSQSRYPALVLAFGGATSRLGHRAAVAKAG